MFSHRKVFALLVVAMAVLALTGCESEVKKKQRLEREMVVEASHKIETALLTTKKVQDDFLKVVKSLSPDSGEAKLKELKKFFTDSENTFRNIEQELQKISCPTASLQTTFGPHISISSKALSKLLQISIKTMTLMTATRGTLKPSCAML